MDSDGSGVPDNETRAQIQVEGVNDDCQIIQRCSAAPPATRSLSFNAPIM